MLLASTLCITLKQTDLHHISWHLLRCIIEKGKCSKFECPAFFNRRLAVYSKKNLPPATFYVSRVHRPAMH